MDNISKINKGWKMDMTATADQMRIIQLKEKLETEIATLKADITRLSKLIGETERAKPSFATDLHAQRSAKAERLTECMVTHDECWPNSWWIEKHLTDFYRETILH